MRILVTGGCGFIGAALVRRLLARTRHEVVNLDALTYAAQPDTPASPGPRYAFEHADVCDSRALARIFGQHRPHAVIHLAAETHVDRSIDDPVRFVDTNVTGTCRLLEAARAYWAGLDAGRRATFRFLQVSTDEVFGSAGETGRFTERSRYDPSSPYAASKAAADHLARAWGRTYGLPVIVTHGCNTLGPGQFPEKLVPLLALKAAAGETLPIYGDGSNEREWLHVDDHADALIRVLEDGTPGESYAIGGGATLSNLELAHRICAVMDALRPDAPWVPHCGLIVFVPDRPGHDRRYALDGSKIREALGWQPAIPLDDALRRTVAWYVESAGWRRSGYRGERLGLLAADVR